MKIVNEWTTEGQMKIGLQFKNIEEMEKMIRVILTQQLNEFGYDIQFVKAEPKNAVAEGVEII